MQPMLQWKSFITYYECVCVCVCVCVALDNQHVRRMRHIVICGLYGATSFSTLSHKWQDFRKKKVIDPKIPVLNFSTTFV